MPRRPEPYRAAPDDDGADRRTALRLVPVSRETEERLAVYATLLRRWQAVKNLVGPATLPQLWTRHIADCAQLPALLPEARRWVDLGSGAGLPGLIVAIILADEEGAAVDLIDSDNRKCAFLREAARETGAPARVHAGRIEQVLPTLPGPVEAVTARALAPLDRLAGLAAPLLHGGAVGLFSLGAGDGGTGLPPGTGGWRVDTHPSKTHPGGRIALVRRA